MSKSALEATFALQLRALGVPEPEREYMFAKKAMERNWRLDFAWPEHMLAVELQGGIWNRGRHSRGAGYIADCEKANAAVLLGWRLLRFTRESVEDGSGAEMVAEMIGGVRHE